MKNRRRIWEICTAVILIGALISAGLIFNRRTHRLYAATCYLTAIKESLAADYACTTFRDVMLCYNANERHLFEFSPDAEPLHTFISPQGLPDGEYLVFVEADPGVLSDWTRYVIFATPDGQSTRLACVWVWEVEDLRRRDAGRRSEVGDASSGTMRRETAVPSVGEIEGR